LPTSRKFDQRWRDNVVEETEEKRDSVTSGLIGGGPAVLYISLTPDARIPNPDMNGVRVSRTYRDKTLNIVHRWNLS